ncbi:MAG: phosphoribosyltransferase [Roseomonas sp.]|nr:phosphoribosyltransferase [Roseomonas sp.]MCA3379670.1 phosphoribosyltransferase [Roseomonas sp.]
MPRPLPLFADRTEAGLKLLPLLAARGFDRPLVYALPRGGVPVALPIAQGLRALLDLLLVRKLGVPWQPELGFGAIAEGLAEPLLNQDIIAHTGLTEDMIAPVLAAEKRELARRSAIYLKGRHRQDPKGRIVILVDDGLATGITARAGIAALRKQGAARLVLAVPIAAPESIAEFQGLADEVITVETAPIHFGIGSFYQDFHQISDAEMLEILARAA